MMSARTSRAAELMMGFAERTGLTSEQPNRRYLWTDAFAVCNFLGLARATKDDRYRELGLRLVARVHRELGRYLEGDRRSGWISGLPEVEAEGHPTRGGLRIGKPLPERSAEEPFDPELEWERDGQYFHYLTKWVHALDQVARWTRSPTHSVWARELAHTAHRVFTYGLPGQKRMVWKLSIDLSRRLVPSMGHHDPLDGFVTCTQLEATAATLSLPREPRLEVAIEDFAQMLDPEGLETNDPLGIGGLLVDVCRLAQVDARHDLIAPLLAAAAAGLRRYIGESDLRAPAGRRLAFRELGLAIGLAGITRLDRSALAAELAEYVPLGDEIASFWLRPEHRQTPAWLEHADINDVMLATALAPDGFLALESGI